jgi:hypothetical protein
LKATLPTYGPTNGSGIVTKEQLLKSKLNSVEEKIGLFLWHLGIGPFIHLTGIRLLVSCAGEGGICYNRGKLVFAIASHENIATRFSKLGDMNGSLESVVNGKGKSLSRGTNHILTS